MAMGRRQPRQEELFIATADLTPSAGHPFYQTLNRLLDEAGFDRWVEARCAPSYAQTEKRGQPSLPPGVYFRMLFVGYFEGIDSQRGIAWRCSDSLSLRAFLGIPLGRGTPDHSTLTNTRKRLPAEVFEEVFQFVLGIAAVKGLIAGKTVGVDSTTLEANAAMKSIVRRDTGEDWKGYVIRLMREAGAIGPADKPEEQRRAALNNRRRMGRDKGKGLQRWRSEVVERTFAHVCETGGSRRTHLRGLANVTKRYLIAAAAHNLGRILRRLTGTGKPRARKGATGLASPLLARLRSRWARFASGLARMPAAIRRFEKPSTLRVVV